MIHIDMTLADFRLIADFGDDNLWTVQFYDNLSGKSAIRSGIENHPFALMIAALIDDDRNDPYVRSFVDSLALPVECRPTP